MSKKHLAFERYKIKSWKIKHLKLINKKSRREFHLAQGTIGEWTRCSYGISYTREISSTIKYHLYLGKKGYRSLVYSGDHDMLVPFVGTQAWIKSLNFSIVDDWRPWLPEGQVAGYVPLRSITLNVFVFIFWLVKFWLLVDTRGHTLIRWHMRLWR